MIEYSKMARKKEDLFTLLSELPWWFGVSFAGVAFLFLKFIVPSIEFQNPTFKALAPVASNLSWVAILFLIPAAKSAFESERKRKLLEQQNGIESIRSLTWKEFEELVAEAYRRKGYIVRENAHTGPDGGIDITLEKDGCKYLVQCKQWRSYKVGVKVAREMLGLVTSHRATGAIIVTCGKFTQEARSFAVRNHAIQLIEENQLVELVRTAQTHSHPRLVDGDKKESKKCPRCNSELVKRVARRGQRAGNEFWGCSTYPHCKHTEDFQN